MHEPPVSAFNCFPYDIQEYHLLFSFEQSMNYLIVKLFYSFAILSISQLLSVCQSVCLSVCPSIYLPTYLYLSKGEVKEISMDAQELVARWQQADPPKKQTWADRQTLLNESWAQSHAEIFKFFLFLPGYHMGSS